MVRTPLAPQINPLLIRTAHPLVLAVVRDLPGKSEDFECLLQRGGGAGAEGGGVN
jgi:hypothetical protein